MELIVKYWKNTGKAACMQNAENLYWKVREQLGGTALSLPLSLSLSPSLPPSLPLSLSLSLSLSPYCRMAKLCDRWVVSVPNHSLETISSRCQWVSCMTQSSQAPLGALHQVLYSAGPQRSLGHHWDHSQEAESKRLGHIWCISLQWIMRNDTMLTHNVMIIIVSM